MMKKNSKTGHTFLQSLIVTGPFINNSQLIVRTKGQKTTWNGKDILNKLGTEFSNDYMYGHYDTSSVNVVDGSRAAAMNIFLPHGVNLVVNVWKSMLAAEIRMCVSDGQQGSCGSFAPDSM